MSKPRSPRLHNLRSPRSRFVVSALLLLATPFAAMAQTDSVQAPKALENKVRAMLQTWPGGPVEDAEVPVIETPKAFPTLQAQEAALEADDLVIGVVVGGQAKAYPIRYLARYEVIGDRIGDLPVAATWCPLSASGVVFASQAEGRELTFDFVRGLIHDNLVISDRETRSTWSQLQGKATAGPLEGQPLESLPSLQTTWSFWKTRHPKTTVLALEASEGVPYHYFESSELRMPPPRGDEHDTSSLGLGLEIWGQAAFFPLRELEQAPNPFTIGSGGSAIHIHHAKEGLTAWAENDDGTLKKAVLAYERSWKAFHPQSQSFEAALACDVAP